MNWIERIYELNKKDLYSQSGEGIYLEYIFHCLGNKKRGYVDIGGGNGFHLSNTRHLKHLGWDGICLDKTIGSFITRENVLDYIQFRPDLLSIDIDGNDYWVIEKILTKFAPDVIIAEFNSAYTDSRTIQYDPTFEWAGDSYFGFTFEAGKKLAENNGYKVIFQNSDMNMYMVRGDLVNVDIPLVTYKKMITLNYRKERNG